MTAPFSDFAQIGEADLESALKGQDVVFSALGATGFHDQKKFIDASIRAGVKRFIPPEFSSNTYSDAFIQLVPLVQQKTVVLEYLSSKESEGLTWTDITRSHHRVPRLRHCVLYCNHLDGSDKAFTPINEKQLGDAVVAVLNIDHANANQCLDVTSVETSQKEILGALEEAISSKWAVSSTSTDAEVSVAIKKLCTGDINGVLTLVRGTRYANIPGLRASYAKDEMLANISLGFRNKM
ncbi:hypothetical protein PENANT_c006G01804 [Penicillium antarcticum]|uniref:NmrA-like domain-containing protein n=1 Tax=Penicillium antarcticum TaxID=416450 RepID=A0A1V6QCZ4_9EURO|nr:hypothetical protein PENANT_c006G01804 [Penicillium antarcticum]